MQTVSRIGFIIWTKGVLVDFSAGKGFAVPEQDCIAAEQALNRGEKVALTAQGKVISHLEPRADGVFEIICND
jgi:hypothetical protein